MTTEEQLTAALARAEVLNAAEEALEGRHPSVVGACTEYRLAEDELPDEFDSEDYCLHKAVASLLRQRDREAKRADAAESELQKIAKAAGHVSLQGAVTICETVEALNARAEAAEAKVKELEAKCAEMRDALEYLRDNQFACMCTTGSFIYGCSSCRAKHKIIDPALSSDYGKGWRSPEEVREMLDEPCRLLRKECSQFRFPDEDRPVVLAALHILEALVKEAKG